MPRIKLCGLRRPEDIAVANELHPDYVGFVFWPHSKRAVLPEKAKALRALLDPSIPSVGVFVDEDIEVVLHLLEEDIIQVAQLHGSETEEYIAQIKAQSEAPVIKALKIRKAEDIAKAEQCTADYVLLDNGYGTGETFDWTLIEDIHRPFFLAGGLTPDNVAEAIKTYAPFAVDVSSGIETDGAKDPAKMKQFVEAVRL